MLFQSDFSFPKPSFFLRPQTGMLLAAAPLLTSSSWPPWKRGKHREHQTGALHDSPCRIKACLIGWSHLQQAPHTSSSYMVHFSNANLEAMSSWRSIHRMAQGGGVSRCVVQHVPGLAGFIRGPANLHAWHMYVNNDIFRLYHLDIMHVRDFQ